MVAPAWAWVSVLVRGGGAGPGQAGPAGAANAALGAGPGRVPLPPQQGAPNVSGRQAIPFAQPNVVPLSGFGARNFSTRPAPGTTTTYAKKGGSVSRSTTMRRRIRS